MHFVLRELIEPLLTRVGSLLAGALVGAGLAAQHGPTVQQAFVIVGLFVVDLLSRKMLKQGKG